MLAPLGQSIEFRKRNQCSLMDSACLNSIGGLGFSRVASLSLGTLSMGYSFNGRLNIDSRLFSLRVTWLSTRFAVHNPVYLDGIDVAADTNLLLTEARLSCSLQTCNLFEDINSSDKYHFAIKRPKSKINDTSI